MIVRLFWSRPFRSLFFILGAFVLMACTCNQRHIYYTPPVQNVPMLTEAGEVQVEGGAGTAKIPGSVYEDIFGCETYRSGGPYFQGAYSPKPNLGISANFMMSQLSLSSYSNNNGQVTDHEGSGKGYMFDVGGGYYTTLDSLCRHKFYPKITRHIRIEAYSGIGYSGQHHFYRDSSWSGTSDLQAFVFHLQPAIGINNKYFTLAISTRLNNFLYNNISTQEPSGYPGSGYVTEEKKTLQKLRDEPLQVFLEPAITLKVGYKFTKLTFQYCSSTNLRSMSGAEYEFEKFAIGINVSLAPRYRWKKG